jgi:hypothetical protein
MLGFSPLFCRSDLNLLACGHWKQKYCALDRVLGKGRGDIIIAFNRHTEPKVNVDTGGGIIISQNLFECFE